MTLIMISVNITNNFNTNMTIFLFILKGPSFDLVPSRAY